MPTTANFRRQHDAAEGLVNDVLELEATFAGEPTSNEAFRVTMLLAKLSGTLRIHLAQEDRHLYPSLMASGQGGVAAIARQYFEEMGQLGPALNAFVERWRNPDAIVAQWAAYRAEQDAVFAALSDRIQRENEVLYPLADQLAATRRTTSAA